MAEHTLRNLQRRLDTQALAQLRQHVATMAAQIDTMENRIADLEERLARAHQDADNWRDIAHDLMNTDATQARIGITKTCDIHILHN